VACQKGWLKDSNDQFNIIVEGRNQAPIEINLNDKKCYFTLKYPTMVSFLD